MAAIAAQTLRGFGPYVIEGIGGTGVVGSLSRGRARRPIGLRADMDALWITQQTGRGGHASRP